MTYSWRIMTEQCPNDIVALIDAGSPTLSVWTKMAITSVFHFPWTSLWSCNYMIVYSYTR
jgi:hypothetical protein